ncbi:hypothetical protein EJB05_43180, partial [Eragrostis curvula]
MEPISIDQIPLISTRAKGNAVDVVPSVDLSATGAAAAVVDACRRVGFFRVTNHGVPAGLADALEASATAFFALPAEDKLGMLGYRIKSIGFNGDAGWLEYLLLSLSSSDAISSLPPSLRTALEEYTAAVREVGGRPGGCLSLWRRGSAWTTGLCCGGWLWPEKVATRLCGSWATASRVSGSTRDPQIISLLRANSTPGLQIKLADGTWAPVHPDPESFFVIVGDSLQVLTNGRFRSVKHRVVAPEGTLSRLSFIYFGGAAPSQLIAPLPQVMREGEQSLYRDFTYGDYKKAAYNTVLADNRLGPFELPGKPADPQH